MHRKRFKIKYSPYLFNTRMGDWKYKDGICQYVYNKHYVCIGKSHRLFGIQRTKFGEHVSTMVYDSLVITFLGIYFEILWNMQDGDKYRQKRKKEILAELNTKILSLGVNKGYGS